MAMYDVAKSVINSGNYKLSSMLDKLDTLWMQGSITDEERQSLIQQAQANADTSAEIDVLERLSDLELRVRALEEGSTGGTTTTEEEWPEYVTGKLYYNGDKVTEGGKHYTFTAPVGVPCTLPPSLYPMFWTEST